MKATTRPRSKVSPHPFEEDPEIPADHLGRGCCTGCGLMGQADDVHHSTTPAPPQARPLPPGLAQAGRDRDAAILGERD